MNRIDNGCLVGIVALGISRIAWAENWPRCAGAGWKRDQHRNGAGGKLASSRSEEDLEP